MGLPAGARRLVGREAEIEALSAALGELARGGGRSIALVGEPGIGKSAVIGAVAARARAAGITVVTTYGRGTGVPSLAAALSARNAHVLVALDDLHLLSPNQVSEVERLVEETATGPLLCLLAYRQRQLSPVLAAALSRAASAGLLEVWDLGPLTLEQSRSLLGGAANAEDVHREAGGNPQYLKVLAAEDGASGDAGVAILAELAGLEPDAAAVVRAAAVLGEPFHPDLLAEVAGLEVGAAMAALDELTRLDLVRTAEPTAHLALRHDAVGKVVYQRLEPSQRVTLHQRAEAALARRAAPIARRAHHVARAADPNRPEHAATLIAAARGALYASPALAGDYLRVALTLLQEGSGLWYQAQVLLVRTRLLTGDATESRELLDALRSTLPDAAALAESSRTERRLGKYTEAGALARSGLVALADRDSATAASLHIELAHHAYDVRDYEASRQHAEKAATLAHAQHDPVGEANALAQAALATLCTGDQATAQATVTRAAELLDAAPDAAVQTDLEAAFQLGLAEGMLGRLSDAERHLSRGAELSRRTGQTYIRPQILTTLANARARSGNLRSALASLDETAEHIARVGDRSTEAVSAMLRAEVLFWRDAPGDALEAGKHAEHAAALCGDTPVSWAITVRCFYAELVLLGGDPARAARLLLEAAGGTELRALNVWRKPRWCDTLAEAAAVAGDRALVEHWASIAEACVEELPSPGRQGFALRARMRAHAIRGDIDRAVRTSREAVADFTASGERLEVCRTLLAVAESSLAAGRTDDVPGWLDRVTVLAGQCGSARLADAAAGLLERLDSEAPPPAQGPPKPLAVLSRREQEIAGLASTGMTTVEIAEALFLSARTVETHLGRIYRKLGVSNRAGLTRIMLTTQEP